MRKISNEELNRPDIETFRELPKHPIVLVLDNLRSMHNVGSAFRTADAFAIEAIYLCGITAQPPHREIHKTALGATDSVEWKYFGSTNEACEDLRKAGYRIAAVEQADQSILLNEFSPLPDEKLALVFGNEVFGVEESIVKSADLCLEIPQFGTKHSINVSVSIGVVLWDILSKVRRA
ncbi:RNA methyltransferase [Roseivirga sp. UBA838]|uniref:RNA methyltransferase n=1 Tax=Roseivirga sp. UBA838 TaxID=1947393 RepID=UPI00257EFCE1|nr:RNA methyltransferase [Roseivirga sp. UBA838]|tara:strand:- start:11727 stop:12260 length:534 start_codon:yes stop_codon:yes gene_type:complete